MSLNDAPIDFDRTTGTITIKLSLSRAHAAELCRSLDLASASGDVASDPDALAEFSPPHHGRRAQETRSTATPDPDARRGLANVPPPQHRCPPPPKRRRLLHPASASPAPSPRPPRPPPRTSRRGLPHARRARASLASTGELIVKPVPLAPQASTPPMAVTEGTV